jgi:hypothetical protein
MKNKNYIITFPRDTKLTSKWSDIEAIDFDLQNLTVFTIHESGPIKITPEKEVVWMDRGFKGSFLASANYAATIQAFVNLSPSAYSLYETQNLGVAFVTQKDNKTFVEVVTSEIYISEGDYVLGESTPDTIFHYKTGSISVTERIKEYNGVIKAFKKLKINNNMPLITIENTIGKETQVPPTVSPCNEGEFFYFPGERERLYKKHLTNEIVDLKTINHLQEEGEILTVWEDRIFAQMHSCLGSLEPVKVDHTIMELIYEPKRPRFTSLIVYVLTENIYVCLHDEDEKSYIFIPVRRD